MTDKPYRKYNPLPEELRRPVPKRCPRGHVMKGDPEATCKVCAKPIIVYDPKQYQVEYAERKKRAHERWLREQLTNTLGMKKRK